MVSKEQTEQIIEALDKDFIVESVEKDWDGSGSLIIIINFNYKGKRGTCDYCMEGGEYEYGVNELSTNDGMGFDGELHDEIREEINIWVGENIDVQTKVFWNDKEI